MFNQISADDQAWLSNPSFQQAPIESIVTINDDVEVGKVSDKSSNKDDASPDRRNAKKAKKHSKKKKKKEHKRQKEKSKSPSKSPPKYEFTGKEDYYVDKRADKSYLTKWAPDKQDFTKYRIRCKRIGTLTPQQYMILRRQSKEKSKRYYNRKNKIEKNVPAEDGGAGDKEISKTTRLTEDEFTLKTKTFNRHLGSNTGDVSMWLEYVRFQQHFYMKMSKIQMAERKMEILNKALRENPGNDQLYIEYVDVIEQTYPSFEVSKFLDDLLQKGWY